MQTETAMTNEYLVVDSSGERRQLHFSAAKALPDFCERYKRFIEFKNPNSPVLVVNGSSFCEPTELLNHLTKVVGLSKKAPDLFSLNSLFDWMKKVSLL